MTVANSIAQSGPYSGNGANRSFPVTFRFLEAAHLQVITTYLGVNNTLSESLYTVTGAGGTGGTVILQDPLPTGYTIAIYRDVPLTQLTDYVQSDSFPAQSHEDALDKLTMIAQQMGFDRARTLRVPLGEAIEDLPSAADRAGRFLGFDDAGNPAIIPSTDGTGALALDLLSASNQNKGAGQVGFSPLLAYPGNTIGAFLRKAVIVADMKPTNTGEQNDAAFLAAVIACQASGGGVVVLPAGDLPVTGLTLDVGVYPNVSVEGKGKNSTVLRKQGTTTAPVFDLRVSLLAEWFGSLSGFTILGNAKLSSGLRTRLIAIFTFKEIRIQACAIGWENQGSLIGTASDVDLRGNATGYKQSLLISGSSNVYPNLITFFGGQVIGNTALGFDFTHGHGITLTGVDIEHNGTFGNVETGGVRIRSSVTQEIAIGTYSIDGNTWFESNAGPSLIVEDAPGLVITQSDVHYIRASMTTESDTAMVIGYAGLIASSVMTNVSASSSMGFITNIFAARSVINGGQFSEQHDTSTLYVHINVEPLPKGIQVGGQGFATDITPEGVNVSGTKVSRKISLNGAPGTQLTLPVNVDTNIPCGAEIHISGANTDGLPYRRVYSLAIRIVGGIGDPVTAVLASTCGAATPTFTFDAPAGAVRVTAGTGSNVAQIICIGN